MSVNPSIFTWTEFIYSLRLYKHKIEHDTLSSQVNCPFAEVRLFVSGQSLFPKVTTNPQRVVFNPSSKLHDNSEICNSMFVDIIEVIQVFVGFLGRQFLSVKIEKEMASGGFVLTWF